MGRGAPGALGTADADSPTLTVYRASRGATGTGVVVAPGGGYGALAMDHEGRQVAAFFNSMGVTAFVLKYRLGPRYHHPIELGDAQRAMRTGSRPRAGVRRAAGPDRDDGLLGRRPPRLDRRHALRQRQARTPPTRSIAPAAGPIS